MAYDVQAAAGGAMSDRWMERAACVGRPPELWFSDDPERREMATHICNSCPVQASCAVFADQIRATHGVWAGAYRLMNPSKTGFVGAEFVHGTPAGYKKHKRRGEKACGPCLAAHNRYRLDRKHGITAAKPRKRRQPVQVCGSLRGYRQHISRAERPCQACRTFADNRYRNRYQSGRSK